MKLEFTMGVRAYGDTLIEFLAQCQANAITIMPSRRLKAFIKGSCDLIDSGIRGMSDIFPIAANTIYYIKFAIA